MTNNRDENISDEEVIKIFFEIQVDFRAEISLLHVKIAPNRT